MKTHTILATILGLTAAALILFSPALAGQAVAGVQGGGMLLAGQDFIPLTRPVQCCHDSGCFQAKNVTACKRQIKKQNLCPSSGNKVKCRKGTCRCR